MRNSRSKSIESICTAVVGNATFVILAFTGLFIFVVLELQQRSVLDSERERINALIPMFERSLSSELFIGDQRAVDAVADNFREKFKLSTILVSRSGQLQCPLNAKPFLSWLQDRVCVLKDFSEISTPTVIKVESIVTANPVSNAFKTVWIFFPILMICAFSVRRMRSRLQKEIVEPIERLAKSPEKYICPIGVTREVVLLSETLKQFIAERDAQQETASKLRAERQFIKFGAQVAHDLGSPLAALQQVAMAYKKIPGEEAQLLRAAIARISKITQGMLRAYKRRDESANIQIEDESITNEHVLSLVKPMICEKRYQFHSNQDVQIKMVADDVAFSQFAKFQRENFERVLSNLINNAVESLNGRGLVEVIVGKVDETPTVTIKDNGSGITAATLEQINAVMLEASSEVRSVKHQGVGLGISHAIKSVKHWEGKLQIESPAGGGTSISIHMQPGDAPAWFVGKLSISHNQKVVVIDDDDTIHQTWRKRLGDLKFPTEQIICLKSYTELENLFATRVHEIKSAFFLIDYDLGEEKSGVDLIHDFYLESRAILVSSHVCESKELERFCVKMLSKSMIAYVPVEILNRKLERKRYDAILLDDEELVHATWRMAAKRAGQTLVSFRSPQELFEKIDEIDLGTPIFIDRNLGTGIRGEYIAEKVLGFGFKNVSITTGDVTGKFDANSELSAEFPVFDKTPPFSEAMEH